MINFIKFPSVFTLWAQVILAVVQTWSHIQHIIQPGNKSQLNPTIYLVTEYFIDQEKYSHLIILHTLAASIIGAIAMVATGTMLLTYLYQTCGMFSIAR